MIKKRMIILRINEKMQQISDLFFKYLNELKAFLYSVFIYLNIDVDIVKILFYLMVIDTILGVIKAFRLNRIFSTTKLIIGFTSKLSVLLIPMTLALIGNGLKYDFKLFVDIVMKILIVNDGISIFTNMSSIRTKKAFRNTDIITLLINFIRKYFIDLANGFLDTLSKNKNN